jgi:polar amino acid transport system ATP-binding protein
VHAIEVEGLSKAYGAVEAVRGIDFCVDEGEVVAVLGPTGPGRRPLSRSSRATSAATAVG